MAVVLVGLAVLVGLVLRRVIPGTADIVSLGARASCPQVLAIKGLRARCLRSQQAEANALWDDPAVAIGLRNRHAPELRAQFDLKPVPLERPPSRVCRGTCRVSLKAAGSR